MKLVPGGLIRRGRSVRSFASWNIQGGSLGYLIPSLESLDCVLSKPSKLPYKIYLNEIKIWLKTTGLDRPSRRGLDHFPGRAKSTNTGHVTANGKIRFPLSSP